MRPSSTLAKELAEREGFELGRGLIGISKLLNQIVPRVPSDPRDSPYLPPNLPPPNYDAHKKALTSVEPGQNHVTGGVIVPGDFLTRPSTKEPVLDQPRN